MDRETGAPAYLIDQYVKRHGYRPSVEYAGYIGACLPTLGFVRTVEAAQGVLEAGQHGPLVPVPPEVNSIPFYLRGWLNGQPAYQHHDVMDVMQVLGLDANEGSGMLEKFAMMSLIKATQI